MTLRLLLLLLNLILEDDRIKKKRLFFIQLLVNANRESEKKMDKRGNGMKREGHVMIGVKKLFFYTNFSIGSGISENA